MKDSKINTFMLLAGQQPKAEYTVCDSEQRKLGAQLLLSEVLEYCIKGLGVTPVVGGVHIEEPNALEFQVHKEQPDAIEMLDGLADVAYTMYWNSSAFGLPLEEAFERVCDNNLEKFVKLESWSRGEVLLDSTEWGLDRDVCWPEEVVKVQVVCVAGDYYAVGKDATGKVRKPSTYHSVDLSDLVPNK